MFELFVPFAKTALRPFCECDMKRFALGSQLKCTDGFVEGFPVHISHMAPDLFAVFNEKQRGGAVDGAIKFEAA